jgi:hypothetical protein
VSWHTTRVVPLAGDDSPTSEEHYQAACVTCEWTGQEWETEFGAEHEADFHRAHPDLSGEHAAITIEENGQP